MAFDILDVIELGSKRVVDVDDDDLPVGLLLVEQGHDAEDLDLLDLAGVADELADLADVERVVVSLGLGLGVDDIGVFPGLFGVVLAYLSITPPLSHLVLMYGWTHSWEGTVVPEVALVGEAVADETKFALLGVLLDGVQEVVFGDLPSVSELS